MNDKKDLTRIEDLSEYLHELQDEESSEDVPAFGLDDLNGTRNDPLPEEEDAFPSLGNEETPEFNPTEDEDPFAISESDESEDFKPETTIDFSSSDFESSSFDEPAFESSTFDEPSFETSRAEKTASLVTTMLEETFDPAPTPAYKPEISSYKSPETFEDIKKFAESTSFTGMAVEGNPSFSVLIKSVRYIEDVNDIISLMKELKLLNDPEDQVRSRLSRGTFLVPRISEFAAIFLAHKLRRFDIDIQIGLSDDIHPPKHGEKPETGLVSKFNLYQNQSHHFHFDDPKLELSQIIISATSSLEGHQIVRYLGVASEHKMLDGREVEDETSTEVPMHYQELAVRLKAHALKASANAVVGLNYQLTPIPSEYGLSSRKYRLTCTGNMVWVNKQ